MFQFSCRLFLKSTFRLSNRTPKITRILTLHQANAPTLTRCNFFKHIRKFIIFGEHNLQTFTHNKLISELLLMQTYLFNIRPKLHHQKWRKLRVTLFRTFSTSPAACWCCSSPNLCPETLLKTAERCNLYIHTDFWIFDQNFVFFTKRRHFHRQCDA